MANPGGFNFNTAPGTSATAPTAPGGFSFGVTPSTRPAVPAPGGFSLGGAAPNPGTGGFNLGATPVATQGTTGGFTLGGTAPAASSTATTGFTLGGGLTAPGATATLSGLLSGPKPAGVTFGQTTQLGQTSVPPPGFGATPIQPSTGLTLGGLPKPATTGLTLGTATQATTGFSLGATGQATSGLAGTSQTTTGLVGTSQTTSGLALGGLSQPSTAGFGVGKPALQTGLTVMAAGINIAAGNSIFGQATTKPQAVGLGGVDPKTSTVTSGGATTDTKSGDGKTLKESQLPPELIATVTEFQRCVKTEKAVQDDLSRSSSKPMFKVQEDVAALRQLLSVVSNGLQRNAVVVDKLKHEMTQELKNAEMSMRTKDIPPGLQYENTAPIEYYHRLVEEFENQMLSYRQQIETLEEHLASTHQPNKLTPDDLILLLRKLHETFVALAAQLHQVHEAVKTQKEHYLNYRKIFLHDTKNIFETEKKPIPQVRHDTATHLGPTAFGGLSNAAAVAMASALTRSQQPAAGPPVAGLTGNLGQTTGFGTTGLFGATGTTTQPDQEYDYVYIMGRTVKVPGKVSQVFGGFGTATTQASGFKGFSGFGTTTTTQSTGFGGFGTGGTATVRPIGFGTTNTAPSAIAGQSTFGQPTGSVFGTPAAVPGFGATGDSPFQLNKPPTSKKKR